MVNSTGVFQKIFTPTAGASGNERMKAFLELLEVSGITQTPQQIAIGVLAFAAILWVALALFLRPTMILGVVLFILCLGGSCGLAWMFIKFKRARRLDKFVTQLELALRLMGNGVRIGLGLRQALAMVIEEMPDPARYEYMRVVGQTNIGISVYDALDSVNERMPGSETLMMSRAIRIQSQTGGDLGKILEHLADTIKERRRIQRKISAITAEGRASAAILSGLPPFLSGFISLTEPQMGHALWLTSPGHVALGIVVVLETLGVITLLRMLKVDV